MTGGASGLGEAIVNRLRADGDRVVVADVDEPRAQQVADNLTAAGRARRGDDGRRHERGRGCGDVRRDSSSATAGSTRWCARPRSRPARRSIDCGDEQWQRVIDVNLKGPFLCMKHGIPAIADSGGGAVVLLGSVLGAMGSPGYAAYCASKGALVNLAKQAAIEHAADGVRVNVVSPSATDTGLFAARRPRIRRPGRRAAHGRRGHADGPARPGRGSERHRRVPLLPRAPRSSAARSSRSTAPWPPAAPKPSNCWKRDAPHPAASTANCWK